MFPAKGAFLKTATAKVHIDDRLDTLNGVGDQVGGIHTFWVSHTGYHRVHRVVHSVQEALRNLASGVVRLEASLHEKKFEDFWLVP